MSRSRWPRLFVAGDLQEEHAVPLDVRQAHYLRTVLRRGPGHDLRLFNGRHGEWQARIASLGRNGGEAQAVARIRPQAAETGPTLLFAPLKRGPGEYLIEKATELGVRLLQPVRTQRTSAQRVKEARLVTIAREAAEQCERLNVPAVADPLPLVEIGRWWPQDLPLLVCAESGPADPLPAVLGRLGRGAGDGGIVIGPEGGFEKYELDVLNKLPFVAFAGLGPRILRAETAAVAALTCWQALLGDWDQRPPVRD